jgi:hypothetical protein
MSPELKISSISPPERAVSPPREEAAPLTPSAASAVSDRAASDLPTLDSGPVSNGFSPRRPSQTRLRGLDPRLILV